MTLQCLAQWQVSYRVGISWRSRWAGRTGRAGAIDSWWWHIRNTFNRYKTVTLMRIHEVYNFYEYKLRSPPLSCFHTHTWFICGCRSWGSSRARGASGTGSSKPRGSRLACRTNWSWRTHDGLTFWTLQGHINRLIHLVIPQSDVLFQLNTFTLWYSETFNSSTLPTSAVISSINYSESFQYLNNY